MPTGGHECAFVPVHICVPRMMLWVFLGCALVFFYRARTQHASQRTKCSHVPSTKSAPILHGVSVYRRKKPRRPEAAAAPMRETKSLLGRSFAHNKTHRSFSCLSIHPKKSMHKGFCTRAPFPRCVRATRLCMACNTEGLRGNVKRSHTAHLRHAVAQCQ